MFIESQDGNKIYNSSDIRCIEVSRSNMGTVDERNEIFIKTQSDERVSIGNYKSVYNMNKVLDDLKDAIYGRFKMPHESKMEESNFVSFGCKTCGCHNLIHYDTLKQKIYRGNDYDYPHQYRFHCSICGDETVITSTTIMKGIE